MPRSLGGQSPIAIVVAGCAAALVLTGCGGSRSARPATSSSTSGPVTPAPVTSTTASSPVSPAATSAATSTPVITATPVLDVAAQQIFARSKAATGRLISLRIVDTVVRSGATQRLDLRFGRTGTAGQITRGGYTFDILFIGPTFYFRAPVSFIRAQYKAQIPLPVKKGEGKYVASPIASSNATPYRSLANRSAVLAGVYFAHPNLRRGPNKKVDGVNCISLVDPGKGTFYVRADNDLPVEIDSTVSDGSKLAFSDFNRVPDPQVPAKGQAVDSKGNPV